MSEKIKIKIEIECWKDEMGNWRFISDDLGIVNGFCTHSNQALIRKINNVILQEGKMKKGCDNCKYCRIQDFTPDPLCWYHESKGISSFAMSLPASKICEHWGMKK